MSVDVVYVCVSINNTLCDNMAFGTFSFGLGLTFFLLFLCGKKNIKIYIVYCHLAKNICFLFPIAQP